MMHKTRLLVSVAMLMASMLLAQLPAAAQEADLAKAKENYQSYCRKCHGDEGKGDGPGAAMLRPKPRDFAECAMMAKHSDDELFKAISEGGDAVGMSADMQPWGGTLSDPEIRALMKLVRNFCKK